MAGRSVGRLNGHALAAAAVWVCASVAVPASGWAQQEEQTQAAQETGAGHPQAGREHVVRRGDTLWDLARFYLRDPFLWPSIFDVNREVVEDPHWIYPSERLAIPPVPADAAGAPTRAAARGLAGVESPTRRTRWYTRTAAVPAERGGGRPTVLETLEQDEPYAVSPHEWQSTPFLADSTELGVMGRLVALEDPAVARDELAAVVHPLDRVYIGRLEGQLAAAGDTLMAVRLGRPLGADGRIIEPLALLYVDAVDASVLTATIVKQFGVAHVGDVVMVADSAPATVRGEPRALADGPAGRIVGFAEPALMHGTTERAFIDVGRADGVAIGDELIAYVPERASAAGPERLPPVAVATLRVIRLRDRSATVRVTDMRYTALEVGLPVRVVRRTAS